MHGPGGFCLIGLNCFVGFSICLFRRRHRRGQIRRHRRVYRYRRRDDRRRHRRGQIRRHRRRRD